MKRITTLSVLMAVLLIVASGAAVAQAGTATASDVEAPEYIMDGTVETAEPVSGSIGGDTGVEEPPAFGLTDPVQNASPVSGPVGIASDQEPKFLL